ncbi:hypothetical protein MM560_G1n306 [Manis javanica]|nr:hypothetical protein MM560_G1n306 [Manis javanica]
MRERLRSCACLSIRMKALPCPCPALPRCWRPGSHSMAEGSGTQSLGKGPPLSVQLLRAQYELWRRQQRAQAHLVVLPKGGNMPAPAESMVSAVWINKERRRSLSQEQVDPEAEGSLEEADRGCVQTPESPWHTHLEMHRSVQTFHQETSLQEQHKGKLMVPEQSLPQGGAPGPSENNQVTQEGTATPEAAQHEHQCDFKNKRISNFSQRQPSCGSNLTPSPLESPSLIHEKLALGFAPTKSGKGAKLTQTHLFAVLSTVTTGATGILRSILLPTVCAVVTMGRDKVDMDHVLRGWALLVWEKAELVQDQNRVCLLGSPVDEKASLLELDAYQALSKYAD